MTTNQKLQDNAPDTVQEPVAASSPAKAESRGGKAPSAFRTISEVADDLRVPQHVLRFWETKFSQVKPLKRGGGRRYYRPEDVALLKKIHHLLYTEGYTIKGVQKLLKNPAARAESAPAAPQAKPTAVPAQPQAAAPASSPAARQAPPAATPRPGLSNRQRAILESMLGELQDLRELIRGGKNIQENS